MYIKKIKLSVDKDRINNVQAVKLDNSSRFIHATIIGDSAPIDLTGSRVTIHGVKPDRTTIFNTCKVIDPAGGEVEIELTNQMLSKTGTVQCLCKIIKDEALLTTKFFNIIVNDTIEADEIISSSEFNALVDALGEVQDIDNKFADVKASLETIVPQGSNIFVDRLLKKDIRKIKLIGDSITAGVGSTGHINNPSDGRLIMVDDKTYTESNKTTLSWANQFRNYIKEFDSSIDFFNAGIGGKSTKWFNVRREKWVENDEDIIFFMMGTNDRWDCASIEQFRNEYENAIDYLLTKCNLLIISSAMSAISDYKEDDTLNYNFTHREIDRVVHDVCRKKGVYHISHYLDMLDFQRFTNADLSVISDGATHPNDVGHTQFWYNIQQRLNFVGKQNWVGIDQSFKLATRDKFSTPAEIEGGVSQTRLSSVGALEVGIPDASTVLTFKSVSKGVNDNFTNQIIVDTITGRLSSRAWNGSKWSDIIEYALNGVVSMVTVADMNTPANIPIGTHFTRVSNANATSNGFPCAGLLITYKTTSGSDSFLTQMLIEYGVGTIYTRTVKDGVLTDFIKNGQDIGGIANGSTSNLFTQPITYFEQGKISYHYTSSSNATEFPNSSEGTLITHRIINNNNYAFQEYHVYQSIDMYKRYWNGTTWSAFVKITP